MDDRHDDLERMHREMRPLHAVVQDGSTGRVRRLPGRPARVRPAPSYDQREYVARLAELQQQAVEADPVVRAAGDGHGLLDHVLVGLGQEIASLRFERSRLPPSHPRAATITGRVLAGLERMAQVTLVRAKLRTGMLDIHGSQFQTILAAFLAHLREAINETLHGPEGEKFLTEFERRMSGWEQKAEEIVRGP